MVHQARTGGCSNTTNAFWNFSAQYNQFKAGVDQISRTDESQLGKLENEDGDS